MWAVGKLYGDEQHPVRMYYTGISGEWSSDRNRAARWVDRRDAWEAITRNGYVGVAETVFIEGGRAADPDQYVIDEMMYGNIQR